MTNKEQKMKMISEIMDNMPSEVDPEFICNLMASMVIAYGLEDSLDHIFFGTAFIVEKIASEYDGHVIH